MKILSFGEILWDQFEQSAEIGGAPFNFNAHLAQLGADSYMVSAVGSDELGTRTLAEVERLGVKRDFISVSGAHPTGICRVTVDAQGQPVYRLVEDTAYDNIQIDGSEIDRIRAACFDAFYFGTLAQRNAVSRAALAKLHSDCGFSEVFCDLNLRQNWHKAEIVAEALRQSTILKLNREECAALFKYSLSGLEKKRYAEDAEYYRAFAQDLAERFNLRLIVITLDRDGAMLYSRADDFFYISSKPRNRAVSTVGAGDSFSACFLYNYFHLGAAGESSRLPECVERAIRLSDFVVTHYGAVPAYPDELHHAITE